MRRCGRRPDAEAPLETEALHGETVMVYDESALGVGSASIATLRRLSAACGARARRASRPSGRSRSHARSIRGPAIKLPPLHGALARRQVTIRGHDGYFAVSADGLALWARHLAEIGSHEADFVAVAELSRRRPISWGGRTSEGIDCSGLSRRR